MQEHNLTGSGDKHLTMLQTCQIIKITAVSKQTVNTFPLWIHQQEIFTATHKNNSYKQHCHTNCRQHSL